MKTNYLVHHGIIGQKWGVRRYQNEDGTLTEAGKRKYGTVTNLERTYIDSSRTNRLRNDPTADKTTLRNSIALDKKVNQRIKNQSTGSAVAATLLLPGAAIRTYHTSRAVGEGAAKAVLRAAFDINAARIVGGVGNAAAAKITGSKFVGQMLGWGLAENIKSVSLQERALYNKYDKAHR